MSLSALRRVVDWDGMTDSGVAEEEPSITRNHIYSATRLKIYLVEIPGFFAHTLRFLKAESLKFLDPVLAKP